MNNSNNNSLTSQPRLPPASSLFSAIQPEGSFKIQTIPSCSPAYLKFNPLKKKFYLVSIPWIYPPISIPKATQLDPDTIITSCLDYTNHFETVLFTSSLCLPNLFHKFSQIDSSKAKDYLSLLLKLLSWNHTNRKISNMKLWIYIISLLSYKKHL